MLVHHHEKVYCRQIPKELWEITFVYTDCYFCSYADDCILYIPEYLLISVPLNIQCTVDLIFTDEYWPVCVPAESKMYLLTNVTVFLCENMRMNFNFSWAQEFGEGFPEAHVA